MSEEAIHAIRQKYTEYTFLYNNEALEDIGNTAEAVQISKLCGAMIEFKIPDEEDIADNVAVLGIVIDKSNQQIVGATTGYIEDDSINDITECAGGARGIGEYLRYFCLLKAHLEDSRIVKISGGISGGIPPLVEGDSPAAKVEKSERLLKYHVNRGASIVIDEHGNNVFTYDIADILIKISNLGKPDGGIRKSKKKLVYHKRHKKSKRRKKKSKRRKKKSKRHKKSKHL